MRTGIIAALSLMFVTSSAALATPPGGHESPPADAIASADVNRLYQQAAAAEASRNAALATLAQYKAAVIEERNKQLTDPNSEALRSPSAWKKLTVPGTDGKLTGVDQYWIEIKDPSGQPLDATTTKLVQDEVAKELTELGNRLSACMPTGWPVVTISFTYQGGRLTTPPEVSELAPLDASSARSANCLLKGINSNTWTPRGDARVSVIWRNVGGP